MLVDADMRRRLEANIVKRREVYQVLAGREIDTSSYRIADEPTLKDPKAERLFRESAERWRVALYLLAKE